MERLGGQEAPRNSSILQDYSSTGGRAHLGQPKYKLARRGFRSSPRVKVGGLGQRVLNDPADRVSRPDRAFVHRAPPFANRLLDLFAELGRSALTCA